MDLQSAVRDACLWYASKWKTSIANKVANPSATGTVSVSIGDYRPNRGVVVEDPDNLGLLGWISTSFPLQITLHSRINPAKVDTFFAVVGSMYPPEELSDSGQLSRNWKEYRKAFCQAAGERARSIAAEIGQTEAALAEKYRNMLGARVLFESLNDEKIDIEFEVGLVLRLGTPCPITGSQMVIRTGTIEMHNINSPRSTYVLGPYDVEMDFETLDITIHSAGNGKYLPGSESYYHPHISSDGRPCWGNIGARVHATLAAGRIGECCALIREFLESYYPEGSYRRMDEESDDEGNNRYDRCYDTASARDCVCCDEDDCPFREDAATRCHDDHDQADCLECSADCIYRDRERNRCWCSQTNDQTFWNCVDCENTDCEHALTEETCATEHATESICAECPRTACESRLAPRVIESLSPECANCPATVYCSKKEDRDAG